MSANPLNTVGSVGVTLDLTMPVKVVTTMPTEPATPASSSHVVCRCPHHGHGPDAPVRVTEATATAVAVEYADPGLQADKQRRYPLDTDANVRAAWAAVAESATAARYEPAGLKAVRARVRAAMHRHDIPVPQDSTTEAVINGKRSFDDVREMVRRALRVKVRALQAEADAYGYSWVSILDISDSDVVWMGDGDRLYQCSYSIAEDGVSLGEHEEVVRTYAPAAGPDPEPVAEGVRGVGVADTFGARVIEAKGKTGDGGRIFRVQVIAYGDSKNGRRYPRKVLESAAGLYDGVKAYDHHRTPEEMATGTIEGLVGYFRDSSATEAGIEADLHLLPSATQAAEALDAALALQAEGKPPLVGISHDVFATFRTIHEGGLQLQEAVQITAVNSADIVSTPAAGGQAVRVVAGGIDNTENAPAGSRTGTSTKESDVTVTKDGVLAAMKEATDDELAAVGLQRASTESTTGKATETTGAPARATEGELKSSFLGKLMIRGKVEDAGLPVSYVESAVDALPDRITEATVDTYIAAVKSALAPLERAGMLPTVTTKVTKESVDKKIGALDAFFSGNYREGYKSIKSAWADYTGHKVSFLGDEDVNRSMLRESVAFYDSASRRASESLDSTSWAQVLGDSITRRMMALYAQPSLQSWQKVVSERTPVSDFRDQKRTRVGGFGLLPTVAQGAPYQPLTSPGDEEAVYAVIKRGGTEDLTLEMIANDDTGAVRMIPRNLGLAAAITLYRYVWDILPTNAATSYDATALFAAGHANTDAGALSQSTLSVARRRMREQAAYGDSTNILSITPKLLVVPPELEEIAYQLCKSAVAVPATPAGPSNTPNMHQGLDYEVVDYYTDANDWYAVADPAMVPTIEMGFYLGKEDPELFTQADPNVGSMFDADKVTYKIRHIYAGTVLDHRGFYRGAN